MILKKAFTIFDFIDEDIWLGMLKNRNDLTHIYDALAARRLVDSERIYSRICKNAERDRKILRYGVRKYLNPSQIFKRTMTIDPDCVAAPKMI